MTATKDIQIKRIFTFQLPLKFINFLVRIGVPYFLRDLQSGGYMYTEEGWCLFGTSKRLETTLLIYARRPLINVVFVHSRPRRIRFFVEHFRFFSSLKRSKYGLKSIYQLVLVALPVCHVMISTKGWSQSELTLGRFELAWTSSLQVQACKSTQRNQRKSTTKSCGCVDINGWFISRPLFIYWYIVGLLNNNGRKWCTLDKT